MWQQFRLPIYSIWQFKTKLNEIKGHIKMIKKLIYLPLAFSHSTEITFKGLLTVKNLRGVKRNKVFIWTRVSAVVTLAVLKIHEANEACGLHQELSYPLHRFQYHRVLKSFSLWEFCAQLVCLSKQAAPPLIWFGILFCTCFALL